MKGRSPRGIPGLFSAMARPGELLCRLQVNRTVSGFMAEAREALVTPWGVGVGARNEMN